MTGAGDNVNSPTAWIEVRGMLTVTGEVATIRRDKSLIEDRMAKA